MSHRVSILPLVLVAALFALLTLPAARGADEENLGRLAAERGDVTKALQHYSAALEQVEEESNDEFRLFGRLIKLTANGQTSNDVPDEAKEHLFSGQEQFNDTTYPSHWRTAASEFRTALREVPWWAEPYHKLALTEESRQRYALAAEYLKLYLLAAPDAANVKQVKARIAELKRQAEIKLQPEAN